MQLYLAGWYSSKFSTRETYYQRLTAREKELHKSSYPHKLESYHYIGTDAAMSGVKYDNDSVFLDSGAFSAFTKGVEIDIGEYCRFINRHKDYFRVASVLDAIGNPKKTYENQLEMERQGTAPLPCFHYGDDEWYLKKYLDNYEYITLGGMVPIDTRSLRVWLDRLWSQYLTDDEGKPRLRVHGFGLTSRFLMQRYPWFSVDSSSWIQFSIYGYVFFPRFGDLTFTSASGKRKEAMRHYDTLPPVLKQTITEEVEAKGIEVERLRTEMATRYIWNGLSYQEMAIEIGRETERGFVNAQMDLF